MVDGLDISSSDLCIPIYLNQQVIFDLLAVFEDGFTQVHSQKEIAGNSNIQSNETSGSLGANIVSFFNINLKSNSKDNQTTESQTEILKTQTHTPASLFCKLRKTLIEREFVNQLYSLENIDSLKNGDFIELDVIIRKNPLIDAFEKIINTLEILFIASEFQNTNPPSSDKIKKPGR